MAKERLYDDAIVDALREDPAFARAYLHQAFLEMDEEGGLEGFLLALRHIVEARGGMAVVAQKAGVSRESLYRTLSPRGNPTLKTLRSVVHATGFQFSALASA
ncbi:putative addiction module antidote protein [Yokenella regensburgei]|jgi:probable addiction module antidote protein|uniref:addiction module antidote protein n=1 Tax=Yokenella regensburgei TaxID=158877 RepID=UPI0027D9A3EB|nr:addiction module antidote protein [Yokenella regensburgei]MDQ4429943.1 putative addiction module antidote protein [Yokenella regensburgei]